MMGKSKGKDNELDAQKLNKSLPKKLRIRFPLTVTSVPTTTKVIERYPLNSPFTYAVIAQDPYSSAKRYYLDEVGLSTEEGAIYTYLLDTLENELTIPRSQINPRDYFTRQAKRAVLKYKIRIPETSWAKIHYFAERDLVGFGLLDGLMRDTQ